GGRGLFDSLVYSADGDLSSQASDRAAARHVDRNRDADQRGAESLVVVRIAEGRPVIEHVVRPVRWQLRLTDLAGARRDHLALRIDHHQLDVFSEPLANRTGAVV